MSTVQQYKCPCCDGSIEFNSDLQKMKCPYCGTDFEMETLRAYDEELNSDQPETTHWDTEAGGQWNIGETEGLRIYSCEACGGEIIGDETLAATSCPFCSNAVVIMRQFVGDLKPDYVIPFKLDKKAAIAALKKHYQGKRLLPKVFAEKNHIDEVKGVYVPVWLYDGDADANIRYKATRTRYWSDRDYRYTETKYYSVSRRGSLGFENVPVDGSTKMADALMESIEPFDFNEAVDFQTAYLAGYLADRYDVNSKQSEARAYERIRRSTEDAMKATVNGYDSVTTVSSQISILNGVEKYALYPVWLLNTTWEGNKYYFAMNGQTGKFAGDLPMDKKAYCKWLFGIAGVVAALVFLVSYLAWLL